MEAKFVKFTENKREIIEYDSVLYELIPFDYVSKHMVLINSFENANEIIYIPDYIQYKNNKYQIYSARYGGFTKSKISYKLKHINVSSNNLTLYSQNGVLYTRDNCIEVYPWGKEDKIFKIPENIKCLDFTIFRYVKNLETLIFQNHITNIFGCAIKTNIKNIILKNKQINQINEKWKLI